MQPKICPASGPPPIASKAIVAPVAASASVRSFRKVAESVRHTWTAPAAFNKSSCSFLRTIFTKLTPSLRQSRLSICPRLEAAAECREGIDETRGAVGGSRALGQDQALIDLDASILRIHGAAEHRHGLTD